MFNQADRLNQGQGPAWEKLEPWHMQWDTQIGGACSIAGINCGERGHVEFVISPTEIFTIKTSGVLEQSYAICMGGTYAFLKTSPGIPLNLGRDRMPEHGTPNDGIRTSHQDWVLSNSTNQKTV